MRNSNIVSRGLIPVGKSKSELEAYKQFLRGVGKLEETVEQEEETVYTDQSSFNEEKDKGKTIVSTKKSLWLKIKDGDFLKNAWVITVLGGFIVLVIFGYFQLWASKENSTQRIEKVEKNLDRISDKYDESQKQISSLDKKLSILISEISKDLEFIKKQLGL